MNIMENIIRRLAALETGTGTVDPAAVQKRRAELVAQRKQLKADDLADAIKSDKEFAAAQVVVEKRRQDFLDEQCRAQRIYGARRSRVIDYDRRVSAIEAELRDTESPRIKQFAAHLWDLRQAAYPQGDDVIEHNWGGSKVAWTNRPSIETRVAALNAARERVLAMRFEAALDDAGLDKLFAELTASLPAIDVRPDNAQG